MTEGGLDCVITFPKSDPTDQEMTITMVRSKQKSINLRTFAIVTLPMAIGVGRMGGQEQCRNEKYILFCTRAVQYLQDDQL